MSTTLASTAADVQVSDRLQPIHVATRYLGGYKSEVTIRDPVSRLLEDARADFQVTWIRE